VLRTGLVDEATIEKLTHFIALVVCTGNTCRSPMGEGLLAQRIADRLGSSIASLENKGVTVMSAGIAAMPGAPAADPAIDVMKQFEIDISDHQSQPITGRLAKFADVILTMTNGHRQALISHWPMLETRTKTIRRDGGDIGDPIGRPIAIYRSTAEQIDQQLAEWVHEFDLSRFE
jgi:protein-tyrosine-phosphatase